MDIYPQKSHGQKVKKNNILNKLFSSISANVNAPVNLNLDFDESQDLIENINKAKNDWIEANMNFEFASDDGMIDYHTYQIKACQARYEYLLRQAKQRNIKVNSLLPEIPEK